MNWIAFEPVLHLATIPLVCIVLLLPFAAILPRALTGTICFGAWATACFFWVQCALRFMDSSGFQFFSSGGYTGCVLYAAGLLSVSLDPFQLVASGLLLLCGGLSLFSGIPAWGGGRRTEYKPVSQMQICLQCFALFLLVLMLLSNNFLMVLGLLSLISMIGFWLLLSSGGELNAMMDAVRINVLHRLGDLALFGAAALLFFVVPDTPLSEMAPKALTLMLHQPFEDGPLAGLTFRTVSFYISACFLLAIGSRLFLFPFLTIAEDIDAAPLPLLGFIHGFTFIIPALLVFFRFSGFIHLGPENLHYMGYWLLLSILWMSARAFFSANAVRIDLYLLYLWAMTIGICLSLGNLFAATAGLTVFCFLIPALLHSLGAAIEAMQGQRELWALGGLWRSLRRSDFTRAVATLTVSGMPGMSGFIFFYIAILGFFLSPRHSPTFLVGLAIAFISISLLALRSGHLVFSGEAPRQSAPANLVEVNAKRWIAPLLLSLVSAGIGLVCLIPDEFVNVVFPPVEGAAPYQTPLKLFLAPVFDPFWDVLNHVSPGQLPSLPASVSTFLIGLLVCLALAFFVCYGASALLYRNGPSSLHGRFIQPWATQLGALDWQLFAPQVVQQGIVTPVLQFCTIFARGIYVVLIDLPITRFPALALSIVQTVLRIGHGGNVQRYLFFAFLGLLYLLMQWWGTP